MNNNTHKVHGLVAGYNHTTITPQTYTNGGSNPLQ